MNYLLSIDLNTTRLNNQNYTCLINSIPKSNLTIHIYNYIEQKHGKLPFNHNEILHPYIGSRKKVALDIPQALDIVEICAKNKFDKVYILCGEYESEFLYNKLNHMNIIFCKILPSTLRQTEENNIVKVDINNAVFESTNAVPDNVLQEISQNHQFENEFESNEILHNVDNYAKEVATTAIERVQPFKLLSTPSDSNLNKNYSQMNNPKETIDLKTIKENFEHIINLKDKNDNKSTQSKLTTKLTPEQIKQIYAFIKYRKLIRQI